jgi:hypothetical protein
MTVTSVGTLPEFAVRIAGLPAGILDELRWERTSAEIAALLTAEDRLRAEATGLGDILYGLVPRLPDAKPRLVALRRALFQLRPAARLIDPALPADLVARVAGWETRRADWARRTGSLPATFAAELDGRRAALRRVAADRDLQHALVSCAPELYTAVRSWLADPGHRPPKTRQLLSLTRYVARMAAKTSPRSTFTAVGLGAWGPAAADDSGRRVVAEPHAVLVQAIAGMLARHPALRPLVGIRVNPSAVRDAGRVWWVCPTPTSPLYSVGLSPEVAACIDPGADSHASRIAGHVDQLIGIGLLEPWLPVPDQADDPLDDLVTWLGGVDPLPDDLRAVRRALDEARAALHGFRVAATADQRLARRGQVEAAMRDAAAHAGVGRLDAALPDGTAFFDNVACTGAAASLDPGAWASTLDDLELVRRLLALFDPKLPFRLGLRRFFLDTFGPDATVPYLSVFRAFHSGESGDRIPAAILTPQDEQRVLATLARSGDARMAEVAALRQAFVAEVAAHAPDPDGVVRLPHRLLDDTVASWPGYLSAPGSITAYVQAGRAGVRVLNSVDTGYGHGLARVRRLVSGTRGSAQVPVSDGPLLAEFDHAFGNTVNLRRASVPYAIDYPGHVSDRPPERVLALGDLMVRHGAGRLALVHRGRPVKPVYTGTIWELLLPPAARFLLDAFAEPAMFVPPHSWWLNPPARALPDGVEHHPRVDVGGLTVRRAFWATRAAEVPRRAAGEHEAAYLLRFTGWLRRHGIPPRTFARVLDSRLGRVVKQRKPMFLDVANWFLVLAFEQSLGADDDLVFFTEVLPALPEAGGRVTEYALEVRDG